MICPMDGSILKRVENSLHCQHNHQFDIARQGYVNLLPVQFKRSRSPGDTKEMVQARRDFLTTTAYQGISDHLNQLVLAESNVNITDTSAPFNLLDAGCGEGYYLARLNQALTNAHNNVQTFGVDIAKFAILAAAKSDKKSQYIVASNKHLPLLDAHFDIIVCAFGFPCFAEFAKKLKPNGKLILVESGEKHLIELRNKIYPSLKAYQQNPYPDAIEAGLSWYKQDNICYEQLLDKSALANLLLMTPHIHKASHEKKKALENLSELNITIDINYRILTKNSAE